MLCVYILTKFHIDDVYAQTYTHTIQFVILNHRIKLPRCSVLLKSKLLVLILLKREEKASEMD